MLTIDALISEWRHIQGTLAAQIAALEGGVLLYSNGKPDPAVTAEMKSRLERWIAELRSLEAEYSVRLQSVGGDTSA